MNATHYEKIRELFVRALDVPVEDREAWLLTTAEGDRDLVADVRDLLDTVDESSAFLETPALGAAFRDDVSRPPQDGPTLPPEVASFTDLQPLGSGGFAHVWSARQKGPFERRVAIKILRHDLGDGDALGRFQVEQRTLARMEHPSIARVFESGVTGDGRPYYVMELVDGPPLTEYADRHELGTRERVRLWRDVCIAVRHAHARGVIHRDLKPSNVLVTEVDRAPVVKVIDFGIAKDVRSDLDADPMTREGSFLGSLAYTSPEQLHADASVADARSDVYALGVLGFELLAGRRPHEARSLAEFVRLATERDATRLRDVDRRFRGDLDWITARALERDPSLRYGTASELASDLEAWLDGRPIRVRSAHPGYFVGRMIRRYRVAIAMLALVIAVTIAAFAVHVRALRDEALHRLGQVEMLVEVAGPSEPGEADTNGA